MAKPNVEIISQPSPAQPHVILVYMDMVAHHYRPGVWLLLAEKSTHQSHDHSFPIGHFLLVVLRIQKASISDGFQDIQRRMRHNG